METINLKPAFKHLLRKRRCLVPADGFYEWHKTEKGKVPFRLVAEREGDILALAGLWDSWRDAGGKTINSFTIVTREASGVVRSFHHRMPWILERAEEAVWLGQGITSHETASFLSKISVREDLKAYPVSTLLNSPANDCPDVLLEVGLPLVEEGHQDLT
jgi:putative SOS response-associated peptidase YedK